MCNNDNWFGSVCSAASPSSAIIRQRGGQIPRKAWKHTLWMFDPVLYGRPENIKRTAWMEDRTPLRAGTSLRRRCT